MRHTLAICSIAAAVMLCSCAPPAEVAAVPERAVGIVTHCSHGGEPITVSETTPVCRYRGRLYYFGGKIGRETFMSDPAAGIHKLPANAIPEDTAPHKSDLGVQTRCAATHREPFAITASTPALFYNRRIYYFGGPRGRDVFRTDPQYFLATIPANRLPKVVAPPPGDIGKEARCARSGEPVTVAKDTHALEWNGKIWYFGGPEGMRAFRADPQGYAMRKQAEK